MLRRLAAFLFGVVACTTAPRPTPVAGEPAPRGPAPARAGEPADGEPEQSVKPGINDAWKSEDIEPLVGRLESESREIFVHRDRLLELVGPRPGSAVADIGAGSGFMTLSFARAVGPTGKVYAVDINRELLDRIAERARADGLDNVEPLLSPENTTPLAPGSVDLVFVCDAYHHFEYPKSTMRSIREALRAGGELIVVDLERIPGVTKPPMLEHVRAGKEVFRDEILAAGFELVREEHVPELVENYVLRFRKR